MRSASESLSCHCLRLKLCYKSCNQEVRSDESGAVKGVPCRSAFDCASAPVLTLALLCLLPDMNQDNGWYYDERQTAELSAKDSVLDNRTALIGGAFRVGTAAGLCYNRIAHRIQRVSIAAPHMVKAYDNAEAFGGALGSHRIPGWACFQRAKVG